MIPKEVPWEKEISPGYTGRVSNKEVDGEEKSNILYFEIAEIRYGEENELVAEGHLKWDGCMNLWFTESKDSSCMTHFCDPEDVDNLSQAIKWIWSKGRLMESWDYYI